MACPNPCQTCEVGSQTITYFAVQPDVLSCPTIVRQVSTVVDPDCTRRVEYYVGDTVTPYTGPLEPRVRPPEWVRVCGSTFQIEFASQWFFDAATSAKYERLRRWDETLGTWVVEWYDYAGNPIPAPSEVDLRSTEQYQSHVTVEQGCASGAPVNRVTTRRYDKETSALVSTTVEWIDSAGAVTPIAPAGWVLGACPSAAAAPAQRRIVAHNNTGTIDIPGLLALVAGATQVHAITLVQIAGTGTVTADGGSGITVPTGVTLDFSALDGVEQGTFSGSAWTATTTGTQIITAILS